MEGAKLILMYMCLVVVVMAADYEIEDEYEQQRKLEARKLYLESYHQNPHHVVTHLNYHVHMAIRNTNISSMNAGRRDLEGDNTGTCVATNPIDQCWRCRPDWEQDRKRLATCALGFGRNTTGGAAGEIYTVVDPTDDDPAEPKPGTLRFGVIQKEPLWIIFAGNMSIKLTQELLICNDKTIDGRGAYVHICGGAGLKVQFVQNVIIHDIEVSDIVPCSGGMIRSSVDHCGKKSESTGDGIAICGSSNVWLDHLTLSHATDGLTDVTRESTAVTVSNCRYSNHNKVMLCGHCDTNTGDDKMQVTVAFNHFDKGCVQRMPRCRYGFFHVVNNDYTQWEMYAIGGTSHPTIVCQGNRFTAPPDPTKKNVLSRVDVPDSEWKTWSWTSQEDLLLDGAIFEPTGSPPEPGFLNGEMIPPKDGSVACELTKFAGALYCVPGQGC